MTGRTDFITDACWLDVWTIWFVLVDDAYQAFEGHYGKWRQRGSDPTFSDSEVITVALILTPGFTARGTWPRFFCASITQTSFRACRLTAGSTSGAQRLGR